MKEYLIMWNSGYGPTYESVEAESKEEAEEIASANAREEFESQVDFSAKPMTEELREDYLT